MKRLVLTALVILMIASPAYALDLGNGVRSYNDVEILYGDDHRYRIWGIHKVTVKGKFFVKLLHLQYFDDSFKRQWWQIQPTIGVYVWEGVSARCQYDNITGREVYRCGLGAEF